MSYKQTQTRDVFESHHQLDRCNSPLSSFHSLLVSFLVCDQLIAEGVTILPLPATHLQNTRHTDPQNSRTRIKLNRIQNDIMSSPAGPSRIGGLGPRHRRPPTLERRAPSEDSDDEQERLTTNFNHPVSANTCRFWPSRPEYMDGLEK